MVTKTRKSAGDDAGKASSRGQFSETIKDSASQIWLAGLGAFAKAQQEGGKVFESLVKEGVSLQRKTQSAAEEKLAEATARMASMAGDVSSRASGQWDKLETIFEERVSRALKQLGVPTAKDVEALTQRVDELSRQVAKLSVARGTRAAKAAPASAKPGRKHAVRKSTPRKSSGA